MNQRTLKDIRCQAPIWAAAVVVLTSTLLIEPVARLGVATVALWLFCAIIGVAGFGLELFHGTQVHLMAQPISRKRLWNEKLALQGAAMVLIFGLYLFVLSIGKLRPDHTHGILTSVAIETLPGFMTLLIVAGTAPILALGLGPLLALTIRQFQGALWIFFLIVFGLWIVGYKSWPDNLTIGKASVTFLLISSACVLVLELARNRFLAFQDYAPFGGNLAISFTGGKKGQRAGAARSQRRVGEIRALITKELCLQQVNLVLLAIFLVLGFFIRGDSGWVGPTLTMNLICLIAPLLIGAAAIAEERRLGINTWHLTLPPSRKKQWFIKLVVCTALTLIVGESFLHLPDSISPQWKNFGFLPPISPALYAGYALGALYVGLLAASSASHFVHAAVTMVYYFTAFSFLVMVGGAWLIPQIGDVLPQKLLCLISVPTLVVFAIFRGYRNFVSIESPGRLLLRSLVGFVGCLVFITLATSLIYNRAWEIRPDSSRSQSPKITREQSQQFTSGIGAGVTIDPSGRLWKTGFSGMQERTGPAEMPTFKQVGTDDDWSYVSPLHGGFAALKKDGSLWIQGGTNKWDRARRYQGIGSGFGVLPDTLTQVTPDFRWRAFAHSHGEHFIYGIRDDGSLWRWRAQFLPKKEGDKVLTQGPYIPLQFDPAKTWEDVQWSTKNSSLLLGRKSDGSLWMWGRWTDYTQKDPLTNAPKGRFIYAPQRIAELQPYNVAEFRIIYSTLFSKLDDGRILVGPSLPPFNNSFPNFCVPLPGSYKIMLLRSDLDLDFIQNSYTDFALSKNGDILESISEKRLFWENRTNQRLREFSGGGNWLSLSTINHREYLGQKTDGSLWYWNETNWSSNYQDIKGVADMKIEGEVVDHAGNLLIPRPFRPRKLGYLDL